MMVSFCAVLFPTRFLDEILNLIESVSEGFPSYSYYQKTLSLHPISSAHDIFFLQLLVSWSDRNLTIILVTIKVS